MLSTVHTVAIPNWQQIKTRRLGIQFRDNFDRFVHIKQLGWFIYVRAELNALSGLMCYCGLLGPFETKAVAEVKLSQYLRDDVRK